MSSELDREEREAFSLLVQVRDNKRIGGITGVKSKLDREEREAFSLLVQVRITKG